MKDVYQNVTERIVAELEAGTAPWVRPWSGEAVSAIKKTDVRRAGLDQNN